MKTSFLLGRWLPSLATALVLINSCGAAGKSVVYRQGPIVLNQTSSFDLDLNQDAIPDFRFAVGRLAGLPSPGSPSILMPYLESFSFNRNDYLLDSQGRILLKAAGFKFGPQTKADETWGHWDLQSQSVSSAFGNTWSGFSGQPPEAFLGVRFNINGALHYGWIRFVVPQTNPPAIFPIITDWAYESRPNTAIRAGEKPKNGK